ncbi:hypothetical protein [Vibrio tapetis]|uniref:Uncharacterized protein n=1 Tax=Vibrio tapetis subsp. tapetis TaxID=1671868 RepID=A0A2N8ZJ62_9VIBR|nr:hypothetical protein [Vibrio tapetis]SON51954.1 protein of unknown function [Vibrio tapetis subsp. tapetis]
MNQLRVVGSVSARKAVVADFCSVRNLCLEQAQHQCLVYKKLSYWSTKVSRYCLRQRKPFCLDVAPGRAQYKQLLDNENVFFVS